MPETMIIRTETEDDEIVISLTEHKTITHDTVRINVQVNAQRDETTDEDELRTKIRGVLNKFIPGAEWRFTGVNRTAGQTRFENVTVSAVTRVPETENKQLVERARAASDQGLELIHPQAAYGLPTEKVRQINRELRVALVQQAAAECAEYNKFNTKNHYRVAVVEFADTPRLQSIGETSSMYGTSNNLRASSAYAVSAQGGSGGAVQEPDLEEGAAEFAVSEQFWVAAQVTLRAKRT